MPVSQADTLPPPASIRTDRDALFLDFDGTLAEIAPAPNLVAFTSETRALIGLLARSFGGALAIVTGRKISEIDEHLAPLKLPVSALYGLVHRSPDGRIVDSKMGDASVAYVAGALKSLVEQHRGLILELKGQTIAVHYRQRPDLAAVTKAAALAALEGAKGLKLIEGKMVVELAPAEADKGCAVRDFLLGPPFRGRRPIYIGDDISDEAAFEVVQAANGITIKIGPGPTVARYRAPDIATLHNWFRAVLGASRPVVR